MSLENIKGTYDTFFSLGDLCVSAIQLRKNNLRPFAGPLDWVGSSSLSNVNRILQNQFAGFLELQNLRAVTYASDSDLWVFDEIQNIVFNHDFKTDKNTLSNLATFPEVKEKYNRRIKRFFEKMESSQRILFIRTEAELEEVLILESILSSIVKNDFRILIVNHSNVTEMVEKEWSLNRVSIVELPEEGKWDTNDVYWKKIFEKVYFKEGEI
ncbi:DUF1796 family putative cysteine peptidase [Priestia megaterium]|uniref:DUF1796 family putative cysteine peptidase n=1 Tax=Priestia megaterium TaxID=1404 RepID=UPI00203FA563|nr:DUF1796 family putative cysteine peptidase [Priestia megaterium]MCM3197168.1 papain-like cysteine peptidase [Priestia megaterium]